MYYITSIQFITIRVYVKYLNGGKLYTKINLLEINFNKRQFSYPYPNF